jgi:hypothetical protein
MIFFYVLKASEILFDSSVHITRIIMFYALIRVLYKDAGIHSNIFVIMQSCLKQYFCLHKFIYFIVFHQNSQKTGISKTRMNTGDYKGRSYVV